MKYQKSNNYVIKGTKIIKVSTCRPTILAVTLNEIFAGTHTSKIGQNTSRGCSDKAKSNLYGSIGWPYLEYASNVWDHCRFKHNINNLEQLKRLSICFMRKIPSWPTYKKLSKDPKLETSWKIRRLNLFRKIYNSETIIPKETKCLNPPNYYSRQDHLKVKLMQCTRDYTKYSFFPKTIKDWNNLPGSVIKHKDYLKAVTTLKK